MEDGIPDLLSATCMMCVLRGVVLCLLRRKKKEEGKEEEEDEPQRIKGLNGLEGKRDDKSEYTTEEVSCIYLFPCSGSLHSSISPSIHLSIPACLIACLLGLSLCSSVISGTLLMARLLNKRSRAFSGSSKSFTINAGKKSKRSRKKKISWILELIGVTLSPFRRLPSINGEEVDLYHLYWVVTAHGGWKRLAGCERFLECFDLGDGTANAALGLKQIYLRYLDAYEKIHFLGEEEDREDDWYNDEEDSRSRRQKAQKIHASVPLSYNHGQHLVNAMQSKATGSQAKLTTVCLSHLRNLRKTEALSIALTALPSISNPIELASCFQMKAALDLPHFCFVFISDTLRSYYGFSTKVYRRTDYDRLTLSLSSPLPNEQDFAINTCTLLSNEGKHTLKLAKCERLLDHLLSHAGVYNDPSYRVYMGNQYLESRNYDLFAFWKDVCVLESVREMILRIEPQRRTTEESGEEDLFAGSPRQRLLAVRRKAKSEIENARPDSPSMFTELTGQRVRQIATIIRNLSFEEENAQIIAKNMTCLSSKWSNLNQMGFDILSNIAGDLVLDDAFCEESHLTEILLSTIISAISSSDRFQVISSLDVLNKLCLQSRNEHYIEHLLGSDVYSQLIAYLSLHDIHLLISTLECLYSLSSLGEAPCSAIARISGAVDSLVSLTTAEAQSYGPKACVLMRVVEYVPGGASATLKGPPPKAPPQMTNLTNVRPHLIRNPTTLQQAIRAPYNPQKHPQVVQLAQTPSGGVVKIPIHSMPVVRHASIPQRHHLAPQPVIHPQQTLKQQHQIPSVISVQKQQQQIPAQTLRVQAPPAPSEQAPQNPPPLRSQQVSLRINNDESNRQLCLSWLRATYETCPGSHIEQFIMYKQYLASMHKMGREDVISDQHHVVCVRTLFGGDVGPKSRVMPNGKTERHFEGVKVRAVPQPLRLPAQQESNPHPNINNNNNNSLNNKLPPNHSSPAVPVPPASPILTNLLHRKSPDPKAAQKCIIITAFSLNLQVVLPSENAGNGMLANLLEQKKEEDLGVNGGVLPNGVILGETEEPAGTPSRKRPQAPSEQPLVKKLSSRTEVDLHWSLRLTASVIKRRSIISSSNTTSSSEGSTVQQPILMKTTQSPTPMTNGGNVTPGNNQKTIIILPYSGAPSSSPPVLNGATPMEPSCLTHSSSTTHPGSRAQANPACPFLCEWSGCMKAFKTPKEVENHAIKSHCPLDAHDDIPCLWNRCDGMKRKRFSLMTHIQDRHCHPQLMKLMAVRRVQLAQNGKSDVPLPPHLHHIRDTHPTQHITPSKDMH
ncbi:Uncharacterized protein FKW44_009240 [Caligus rogercresseyi]|uniref:ARID domain-containing protein n=1 Tax=Caligus rogercresseyi TaxID=217165 RepID=A0A7T8HG31_CALRO|nr:Uncharacterized protein FKW44_009240 [Caligus rogercresseyi]